MSQCEAPQCTVPCAVPSGMHCVLLVLLVLPVLLMSSGDTSSTVLADRPAFTGSIATGGNPASLVVWGAAEPLAVLHNGTVLAARTRVGHGRVVCLGHGGFLDDHRGSTQAFLLEQLRWLAENLTTSRAWGLNDGWIDRVEGDGWSIVPVQSERRAGNLDLSAIDLIAGSPQAFARAGRLEDLARWLDDGGRMLVLETAWGQLQLGHASSIETLAANLLLRDAGIMYTERALSPGQDGLYVLDPHAVREAHAGWAMAVLAGRRSGDVRRAARVAREALALVPLESPLLAAADLLAGSHADELRAAYEGMVRGPLTMDTAPLANVLLDVAARRARSGIVRAHPSAVAFPGPVPEDLARMQRTLRFDTGRPGWRSTGLYAAPGEPVRVRVTGAHVDELATLKLAVQIGCWLDPQHFDDRVRMPVAVFRADIEEPDIYLASPIGGPIYIDVPEESFGAAGGLLFEIDRAVPMPRYVLDETDLEAWRTHIRHLPVAWAELESEELVFTIPAAVIRDLDHPDRIMRHWDRVHRVMQEMEPRSPRHWPHRQYRYVADRRLSWGYMYCPADAPIVIPESAAGAMVDETNFDAVGPNHLWGQYHEMGHAHQNPMWTFSGTGEVTVNIFTVLALNKINGYALDAEVMRTTPEEAWARFEAHREMGAPYDRWTEDPFLALQTYAMLWHAFGWEAFRTTFRAYDELPPGDRPRTDEQKRDRFVIEFSRTVGHDLGPYFTAWGVPITDAVARAVGHLPTWMPESPAS